MARNGFTELPAVENPESLGAVVAAIGRPLKHPLALAMLWLVDAVATM